MIDTHAHLNDRDYHGQEAEVLQRAVAAGVQKVITVGYDLASSRRGVSLAEQFPDVYAAVGIHPHDAARVRSDTMDQLRRMAAHQKVVALGEMGLDFYRDLSPRDVQERVFRQQIRLARELQIPVVIHDRDAHEPTLRVLAEEGAGTVGGVMHCFSGSWQMAKQCLDMGFYISLAGPVTYRNAVRPQEVARLVPLDRLLVETDAPYLTPEPHRGKRNEPALVRHIVETIARLRNMETQELGEITAANARRLFRLDHQGR